MKKKKVIIYECLDFITGFITTYYSRREVAIAEGLSLRRMNYQFGDKGLDHYTEDNKLVTRLERLILER